MILINWIRSALRLICWLSWGLGWGLWHLDHSNYSSIQHSLVRGAPIRSRLGGKSHMIAPTPSFSFIKKKFGLDHVISAWWKHKLFILPRKMGHCALIALAFLELEHELRVWAVDTFSFILFLQQRFRELMSFPCCLVSNAGLSK